MTLAGGAFQKHGGMRGWRVFLSVLSPWTRITEHGWPLMKPGIDAALAKGWTDSRSLAIAMGISNSLGSGKFKALAANNGWNPEAVLSAHVGSNEHRMRRRAALSAAFPQ